MSAVIQIPDRNNAHKVTKTLPPAFFSVRQEEVVVHVPLYSFIDDLTDGPSSWQCVGEFMGAVVMWGLVFEKRYSKYSRVIMDSRYISLVREAKVRTSQGRGERALNYSPGRCPRSSSSLLLSPSKFEPTRTHLPHGKLGSRVCLVVIRRGPGGENGVWED